MNLEGVIRTLDAPVRLLLEEEDTPWVDNLTCSDLTTGS